MGRGALRLVPRGLLFEGGVGRTGIQTHKNVGGKDVCYETVN